MKRKIDMDSALRGFAVVAGGLAFYWLFRLVVDNAKKK